MDAVVTHKVADFFGQYPRKSFAAGQILVQAHDEPTHVFHLLAGRVKQYDISYRGDEVVLNVFKPPAFFPMSYAINRLENVYFFEAETEVEARLAPLDDVVAFIKEQPDVMFNLLARVYRGTDGLLGRLAHTMAASARSRVMYELLIQARRFGETVDGTTKVPANEGDIASQAGLARETVSREIAKLKRDGFIRVQGGHILITDITLFSSSIGLEL